MIQFNELRIPSEGDKLIIDVSIQDLPGTDNVYIDSINIDNQDTFVSSGLSKNPIYVKTLSDNNKNVRLEISNSELTSINSSLFFVYIKLKGGTITITVRIPGVVYYKDSIYYSLISASKELECTSVVPKTFIDIFLKYKVFEMSILTKDYIKAVDYYNRFIKNLNNKLNQCVCYG